jgi:hypothetical protein
MVTSSVVIQALSKEVGIRPVTLGHTVRLLREAGGDLWPLSGKGGGKSARHVEPGHFANLILAFAGSQPSEALSIVARLGAARWVPERRADRAASAYPLSARTLLMHRPGNRSRDFDLRGMLALLVQDVAESETVADTGRRTGWTLWLNPDLGNASVTWIDDGKEQRERYEPPQPGLFTAGQQSPATVERLVKIPFALIELAAGLSTGTPAQQDPKRPSSATPAVPPLIRRRQGDSSPPAPPSHPRSPQRTKGSTTSPKKNKSE